MPEATKEKLHIMVDSGLIHYFPEDDTTQPPVLLGRLVIVRSLLNSNLQPQIMASGYGDVAWPPYSITVEQAERHNAALEETVMTGMEVAKTGDQVSLTYRPAGRSADGIGTTASVKLNQTTVSNRLKFIKGGRIGFTRFGRSWEGKLSQRGQPENVLFTCVAISLDD